MLLWIKAETKRQASQRGDSTRFISTGMERCGNGFPGLLHQYSAQQAPRADQPQDIGRKPAEIKQTNAQDWHQPQRECATNENWSAARLPDFPVVQQHLPERHRPKVAGRKVPRETGRNLAPLRG